jgi:hypothetical protein
VFINTLNNISKTLNLASGNTIFTGQSLALGQFLMSPNGCFKLIMQFDNVLAQYRISTGKKLFFSSTLNVMQFFKA